MRSISELKFADDAHLVFDFDGTLAEFVSSWKDSRPDPCMIKFIDDFLSATDSKSQRKISIITGRPSLFIASILEFAELMAKHPGRFVVNGHYGEQVWSNESDHVLSERFIPYADSVKAQIAQMQGLLEKYRVAINALGPDTLPELTLAQIEDFVIQDNHHILTLHHRRVLEHYGLKYIPEESDPLFAVHSEVVRLSVELAQKILEELNAQNPQAQFRFTDGEMVCELIPRGDGLEIDKSQKFEDICEPKDGSAKPSQVVFFGDSFGDAPVFRFIHQCNLVQANVPVGSSKQIVESVMVDSSHKNQSPDLNEMRDIATYLVGATWGISGESIEMLLPAVQVCAIELGKTIALQTPVRSLNS